MVIVYRISEEDFTEAQKLFMSGQKRLRRWSRRLMPWEGGFSLIVGVAGFFTTRDRVVPTFLCLVGVYLLYCSFAIRRYFRRLYRTDQRYKHDIKAEVSENGIHLETPFADSHMKWASVVRWLALTRKFVGFLCREHAECLSSVRVFLVPVSQDSSDSIVSVRLPAPPRTIRVNRATDFPGICREDAQPAEPGETISVE